jgi:hypothetical protein
LRLIALLIGQLARGGDWHTVAPNQLNMKNKTLGWQLVGVGFAAFLTGSADLVIADPYLSSVPEPYSSSVSVPPGHLPPPGRCRIWFPDRPPGHQPPPGDCYRLQFKVPPGAVLVRG